MNNVDKYAVLYERRFVLSGVVFTRKAMFIKKKNFRRGHPRSK